MVTPKEIGKIFKEARESRELSIEQAYGQCRIHPNVIRDIETGVFDRIGKAYLKSFLKKYSTFLGLDTEDIIKKYESISSEMPSLEFDLGTGDKEDPMKVSRALAEGVTGRKIGGLTDVLAALTGKKVEAALVVILSVVFVVLVFVLIGVVSSRMSPDRQQKSEAVSQKAPVRVSETVSQKVSAKTSAVSKIVPEKTTPGAQTSSPVVLKLKARGEVWIQVSKGKSVLFSGTLKEGASKTWKTDGTLTVWTGKAEMLNFIVNTRKIGVVTRGVVKNIRVSSKGIRINDVWVSRL
ncbi:helix-turn-helix domain-containing protein [Candidatus Omnitrophota bacterium]